MPKSLFEICCVEMLKTRSDSKDLDILFKSNNLPVSMREDLKKLQSRMKENLELLWDSINTLDEACGRITWKLINVS